MVKEIKIEGEIRSKRGQVTTFVILGIVVLAIIVAGVILISNYNKNRINVNDAGATEFQEVKDKLDFMFKTCVEEIVKDEAKSALLKGGSMGEEFPINNINYKNELIIVSFDRDNPYVMFKTGREMAEQLQQKLTDKIPECFTSVDQDPLLSQYDMNVYINSVYVRALENSFMVDYDYEMDIDNKSETHTLSQNVDVSIFKILNEANNITDEFLRSYDDPDLLYNLQACNAFYEKYNVKPEYPVDILRTVANNTYVTGIIVQNDFFIVNMDVDGEDFSFAIRPVLIDSIC